jgi:hypothetical protein
MLPVRAGIMLYQQRLLPLDQGRDTRMWFDRRQGQEPRRVLQDRMRLLQFGTRQAGCLLQGHIRQFMLLRGPILPS